MREIDDILSKYVDTSRPYLLGLLALLITSFVLVGWLIASTPLRH